MIGRSRGGPTTKIHALADGDGCLYAVMLTAGSVHDVQGDRALLASVPPMRQLIADKAYDAYDVRAFLSANGTEPVASPMRRRLVTPPFNASAYRARNLIERACYRPKDWRAIATRYDKTARNFLAGVCLAHRRHTVDPMSPHASLRRA